MASEHYKIYKDARDSVETLIDTIEALEFDINELGKLSDELQDTINDKDEVIKELQFELSKIRSEIE